MVRMQPSLAESKLQAKRHALMALAHDQNARLDRLQASASELAAATGSQCLAAQADVRNPKQLQDAVAKTMIMIVDNRVESRESKSR